MEWWPVFRLLPLRAILKLIQASGPAHTAFHRFPLEELLAKASDKREKLACFVTYWWHLPRQGSAEWLSAKESRGGDEVPSWGGSEADALLGTDKYKTMKQLLAQKIGVERFDGSTPTRWGNLCEEISSLLTEMLLRCETYETGSIPGMVHEGNIIQRYSPDRLGVVEAAHLLPWLDNMQLYRGKGERQNKMELALALEKLHCMEGSQIVLFEYKNPWSRTPNGEIPRGYVGQIQAGLGTLTLVDLALFVDLKIRKCKVQDFGINPRYDTRTHTDFKEITNDPHLCGVIGFYRQRAARAEGAEVSSSAKQKSEGEEETTEWGRQLAGLIRADVLTQGSDFAYIRRRLERGKCGAEELVPLLALANRFLRVLEPPLARTNEVVEEALGRLMTLGDAERRLISPILDALYTMEPDPCTPGVDYGALEEGDFESFLERQSRERLLPGGLRCYYPKGFYLPEITYREYPNAGNYIDLTLPEPERAQRWLARQLRLFNTWCLEHDCEAVGFMPWKNFAQSIIPMPRCETFMPRYREAVVREWENMREILRETRRDTLEATMEARSSRIAAIPEEKKNGTKAESPARVNGRVVRTSAATVNLLMQAGDE